MNLVVRMMAIMSMTVVVGLSASPAGAVLLASDSFEYSGSLLDTQNGGTGWSAPWVSSGFALSNDGVSLLYPDGSSDTGSRISEISGSSGSRIMSTGIDMNADATYYYSLMINKADGGSLDVRIYDGGAGRWRIRWGSSEALSIGVASSTGTTVGTYDFDQTLFLVTKMQTVSTGDDTMSIAVFEPGDLVYEPYTWDATNAAEMTDLNLTQFGVYRNLEGAQVDAIRVGTTWADVVPISYHPGDANADGMVNLADLQILGDNWQSTTAAWVEADFTGDNAVNLADLQIIGDNWGYGTSPDIAFDEALAQVGIVIPEPVTTVLLLPGAAATLLLRRRVTQ